MTSFAQKSHAAGQLLLTQRSMSSRKLHGQYLTPEPIARFMANQIIPISDGQSILDPSVGSGTLLCAIIDELIAINAPLELYIDGFEVDEQLLQIARTVLQQAVETAAHYNINIHLRLFHADFVLNSVQFLRPALLATPVGNRHYDHIIANPPYFKLNTEDNRRQAVEGILPGYTNIYTIFMGFAARMVGNGRACFIVPRSFCSGAYFAQFRREFITYTQVQRIHLFEARNDAFSQDDVLQENLIITFRRRDNKTNHTIKISSSASLDTLNHNSTPYRKISQEQFISPRGLFRIPTSDIDEAILAAVDTWPGSLEAYDMEISTGPVVPFRAKQYLQDQPEDTKSVPLLWMQHVRPWQVTWPLRGFRKPQYITEEPNLVVNNTNYVLLRRFSAKEDNQRLVAAPYISDQYPYQSLGLENHLNYIYCRNREMTTSEAIGLVALLNSNVVDRYFRASNGNTQVNATELRTLPLPALSILNELGALATTDHTQTNDEAVIHILQQHRLLPTDIPLPYETQIMYEHE